MNDIFAFIDIGLRASYAMAGCLAVIAFRREAFAVMRTMSRMVMPAPDDLLPLVPFLAGLGANVFIGKRVLMSIFFGQQISFDRGLFDAVGTALGLYILTLTNFLPAWSKARWNGNDQYGRYAAALVIGFGATFALFYWHVHKM